MIRKSLAALLLAAAGAAGALAIAAPASASGPGDGVANVGEFVLFSDKNYKGYVYDSNVDVNQYDSTVLYPTTTVAVNDTASSLANYNTTTSVKAYTNFGYGGSVITALPYGQQVGGQSYAYYDLGTTFGDSLSSHKFQ
jgi:hypothetical protein